MAHSGPTPRLPGLCLLWMTGPFQLQVTPTFVEPDNSFCIMHRAPAFEEASPEVLPSLLHRSRRKKGDVDRGMHIVGLV